MGSTSIAAGTLRAPTIVGLWCILAEITAGEWAVINLGGEWQMETAPAIETSVFGWGTNTGGAEFFQEPVIDRDLSTPPGAPTVGDRYIVAAVATGAWTGREDDITEWNGAAWVFTVPIIGMIVFVNDEVEYVGWTGSAWIIQSFVPHALTHITGGSDVIPNAVASGNAGLLSGADKAKLDGLTSTPPTSADIDFAPDASGPPEVIIFGTDVKVYELDSGDGVLLNFELPDGIDLTTVDPVVVVNVATSQEDDGATNGTVLFQLTTRYVADGELLDKVIDETLTPDGAQPTIIDTLTIQQQITFTLDRTKIAVDDVLTFQFENLGGGTYLGKVGVIRTAKLFYRML